MDYLSTLKMDEKEYFKYIKKEIEDFPKKIRIVAKSYPKDINWFFAINVVGNGFYLLLILIYGIFVEIHYMNRK